MCSPTIRFSDLPFEWSTKTDTINLVSADGSSIPVRGWKRVPLSIGGSATNIDFLMPDVVYPILWVYALNQIDIGFNMNRDGGYLYRGNDKEPVNIINSLPYCHLKRFFGHNRFAPLITTTHGPSENLQLNGAIGARGSSSLYRPIKL